jgi:hypothetical protein
MLQQLRILLSKSRELYQNPEIFFHGASSTVTIGYQRELTCSIDRYVRVSENVPWLTEDGDE